MCATILTTTQLSIGYGLKTVQHNLNLQADKGSLICLVGTNGAGKSTLLRTLAGLQPMLAGNISIEGKSLKDMTIEQRAKSIALVLTDRVEIENTTVRELVAMGRFPYTDWRGKLKIDDLRIVEESIEAVNLTYKKDALISEISDGEKQRAVIAKAIAQNTPLIMLDEPTAHLDLPNRVETMLLLRKLASHTNKTFIMSTHELEIALQMADDIWLMTAEGVEKGHPIQLLERGSLQSAFHSDNYTISKDGHIVIGKYKTL